MYTHECVAISMLDQWSGRHERWGIWCSRRCTSVRNVHRPIVRSSLRYSQLKAASKVSCEVRPISSVCRDAPSCLVSKISRSGADVPLTAARAS